jgi:hypothetical protein
MLDCDVVYAPPMNFNPARAKGKDVNHVHVLSQSFANGINYSKMPPAVYKKSQIVDGRHYEYVLGAGIHRFDAIELNGYKKWIFGVYEFAQNGYSFEDSFVTFQNLENNHEPQKESSEEDVANSVSRLIAHGSKLVNNTEESIREYVDMVCSNKHWQTRGKIVKQVIRNCGAYQDIVTYTAKDAFKWITNNTDYTYAGNLDKKRKQYGWTVLEGYEYEYVVNAAKKYAETGKESYFICHTKPPTEKMTLDDKRTNMVEKFEQLDDAFIECFKFYQENNRFPWTPKEFLPQNHKTKEKTLISI